MCLPKKAKIKREETLRREEEGIISSKEHQVSKNTSKESLATPTRKKVSMKSTKSFKVARSNKEAAKKGGEWIRHILDSGVEKTVSDFRSLACWKPETMTTEAYETNKNKARYKDIPCQDEKRVLLNFPGLSSDFIHANYVATPKSDKRFICTQGPLEGTQHAFWAMVVQEKTEVVVMLCNTVECGKIKCHQYWPQKEGEEMKFGEEEGEIVVTNKENGPLSDSEMTIRVTKLVVKWKDGERAITHYQWEDWPDRGVPPNTSTVINLIAAIRPSTSPIIVHCSAGIGRTGTVVAIAYVQERMQSGECCMAMDELLKTIRRQRPCSIQNEMQYIYLHRVLLTYLLERHKERFGSLLADPELRAKWEQWCVDYTRMTG